MTNLWKHQQRIVDYMAARDYGLINAGMGTGKTYSTLTYIGQAQFGRTLVITKQKAVDVWLDDYTKFDLYQQYGMIVVSGANIPVTEATKEVQLGLQEQARTGAPLVVVINYERVWREPLHGLLVSAGFDALILDESHKAKSHNGKISNTIFDLSRRIPKRLLLTGTPMPNGPMDMYGQWRIMNPALVKVNPVRRGFTVFRDYYANTEPVRGAAPGVVKITSYKNMEQFNSSMQATTLQIRTEDVLDLPPEVDIVRRITLGSEARRLYKSLNKEMIAEVGSGQITVSNILVKIMRLHQITGGFIKPDREVAVQVDREKLDNTLDIIDSLPPDEPVVIFAKYTAEIQTLDSTLRSEGYSTAILSGQHNTLKFWQDGMAQIILVQIDSGAEGISLTRARYGIFYSLGYSLGQYEQARARLNRPGQTGDKVWFYHLVADNTVDNTIYQALETKSNVNAAILDSLRDNHE